jgi:hypothetical protein
MAQRTARREINSNSKTERLAFCTVRIVDGGVGLPLHYLKREGSEHSWRYVKRAQGASCSQMIFPGSTAFIPEIFALPACIGNRDSPKTAST